MCRIHSTQGLHYHAHVAGPTDLEEGSRETALCHPAVATGKARVESLCVTGWQILSQSETSGFSTQARQGRKVLGTWESHLLLAMVTVTLSCSKVTFQMSVPSDLS